MSRSMPLARLNTVTPAPGTTPPDVSMTRPVISAVCANAMLPANRTEMATICLNSNCWRILSFLHKNANLDFECCSAHHTPDHLAQASPTSIGLWEGVDTDTAVFSMASLYATELQVVSISGLDETNQCDLNPAESQLASNRLPVFQSNSSLPYLQ